MNPWRKCKDELPEPERFVLCYSNRAGQFVGRRDNEVFLGHEKVFFKIPGCKANGKLATHWKYLDPDPEVEV